MSVPFELPALEAWLPEPAAPAPDLEPAEDPVELARAEADAIRAAAREEGFAAGLAEGRAELAGAARALGEALAGVEELRGCVADEVEEAAVALGLRIAEQALTGAVSAQPERVVDVVRGALRRLGERSRVTVLVHPDDLDAVREATADLMSGLGGIETCDVQAERRMTRGGAVVRTEEGEVDATLETKLERAREVVAEELAGER